MKTDLPQRRRGAEKDKKVVSQRLCASARKILYVSLDPVMP
jgi:hypothetical protein